MKRGSDANGVHDVVAMVQSATTNAGRARELASQILASATEQERQDRLWR
jgi:hypothetical protein